jgi:uncharacterized membrane protein YhaH (DUF805 family)
MFSGLFGFSGRIGRGAWWFSQLVGLLIVGALFASAVSLHDPNRTEISNNDFLFLVVLAVSLIAIAVINICSTVKRYHDRGKSGWWYFMSFVPLIGGIWQLIECGFCSGNDGDNDYGPPPGSAKSFEHLESEISTMRSGTLAKVDDDYLAKYAQKLASSEAQHQTVTAPNMGQRRTMGPVFGKR